MSSHGGAVAEASPYLGSIFPVVMLQSTPPGPATHRPAAPICLVRHARTDGSDGATSVSMSPGLRARPLEGPPARPTWQSVRRGSQLGAGRRRRSRSGRAWSMVGRALSWVVVGDAADEFEIRPTPDRVPGLLFVPVPEEKAAKNRLHPDFRPVDQTAEVGRLLSLGARRVDVGQRDASWVVLADPEGNEFCILRGRVRPDS